MYTKLGIQEIGYLEKKIVAKIAVLGSVRMQVQKKLLLASIYCYAHKTEGSRTPLHQCWKLTLAQASVKTFWVRVQILNILF